MYWEMHDEARHGLSGCSPDQTGTVAAGVMEGGEISQMGRTKERQIAQSQIERGTSEFHEIAKLTRKPPPNKSISTAPCAPTEERNTSFHLRLHGKRFRSVLRRWLKAAQVASRMRLTVG